MIEMFALLAFSIGVTALFIGWIWGIVSARPHGAGWMLAMLLLVPQAVFALMHWQQAKTAFWITSTGLVLVMLTMLQLPG